MRILSIGIFFALLGSTLAEAPVLPQTAVSLFDGVSLKGWEGNAAQWRVQGNSITGGSLTERVPHNDFLASTRDYENFLLSLEIKLSGTEGFINSGIQIRSQRVPNDHEMCGYQCDFGPPDWYGCIYDESRRNKVMARSDMKTLAPVIKADDWNTYVIKADGPRVQTWINGVLGVDFTEADPNIQQSGKIGLQVHGGGKALVEVRNIRLQELAASPKKAVWTAPTVPKMRKLNDGPLPATEQKKLFSLPPGFEIELVAAEQEGIGKFITVAWDSQERLWTMTALEYPVDGNENIAAAEALYASKSKDKIVIYDKNGQPQIFADGLAIPLGLLPYKDGVIVQHGREIVHLRDTNGDGKADKREVLLEGLGIEDSHLFLHGFTRGPGNWIYTAQGAFNHSRVKARDGSITAMDYCKMGRFTPDGQKFELVAAGLNNIWGFVIDRQGRMWGQEANDLGYPITEFQIGDNFPGIGNQKLKPYAPIRPKAVKDWQVGGTGLSGLALQEDAVWPVPYGPENTAMDQRTFYLANPITNRIQSTHALPDGKGHFTFTPVQDFVRCADPWFRPIHITFGPDACLYIVDWYNKIISHNEVPRSHPERDKTRGRIWRVKHVSQKSGVVSRWHEKQRIEQNWDSGKKDESWPLRDLRAELKGKSLTEMSQMVKAADGTYDVEFTNYMVRAELETRGSAAAEWLEKVPAEANPEFVILATHLLDGRSAAKKLVELLPKLARPLQGEELLRLAEYADEPTVRQALANALKAPQSLEGLLKVKNQLNPAKVTPLLTETAQALLGENRDLALKLIKSFRLAALEPVLAQRADAGDLPVLQTLRVLGAKQPELFLKLTQSPDAAVRDEALLGLVATPDRLLPLWSTLNQGLRKTALTELSSSPEAAQALVTALSTKSIPSEDLDGPTVERLQATLGKSHAGLNALLERLADLFRPVLVLNGDNNAFADAKLTLEGPFTVETWIRLAPDIGNADGILGAPDVIDANFYDGKFRLWVAGLHDVIVAKKPVSPDNWTHVCLTRDHTGHFKIYLNGELDQAESRPDQKTYPGLAVGRTNVPQGTNAALTEYRVWNRERTASEILASFDRVIEKADGLVQRFSGTEWPKLRKAARVAKTSDFPTLLTDAEAKASDEKMAKYLALAKEPGNAATGKNLAAICTSCHQIGDTGGQIGPNLSGVGAMGIDAILRNIITPNAAMEAGYRVYQIQLTNGTVKDVFLAQQDENAILLRIPGLPDERIERTQIRHEKFLRRSLMPEGLLDGLPPELVRDLLAYLQSLK